MTQHFSERPGPGRTFAAGLYGLGVALRARAYGAGLRRPERAVRPVVSVGNLTVGGTGKTPAVIWLARELRQRGRRPAILTRGYGRDESDDVVLAAGRPVRALSEAGDEPLEMARALPSVPIVIGRDRRRTARLAVDRYGADLLLLDDGFQHWSLARDVDLVLLDAVRPFGNGRLLPAGPLREPASALRRASIVILTRASDTADPGNALRSARELAPDAWVGLADHQPLGWTPMEAWLAGGGGEGAAPGGPVVATAGIAEPARLKSAIEAGGGGPVVELLSFPDHHRYGVPDLERVRRAAEGRPIVTTAKDAIRWRELPGFGGGAGWWVFEIAFAPRDAAGLLARIEAAVG